MKRPIFIFGIGAAATIICGYVGTQYLGKNIMYAIGGAIVGTGITTFITDRIARQIEANQILLGQPQPNSWRGYANDYAQGKPLPIPTNCKGCKYYHGIPYNGVTLNCAIHPQGCFGEQCPDWQGFQESIQLDPTERIVNILFQPDEDEPTGHVTIFRCLGDWHEEELNEVGSRKSEVGSKFSEGDLTPTENLPVIEPGDLNPRSLLKQVASRKSQVASKFCDGDLDPDPKLAGY